MYSNYVGNNLKRLRLEKGLRQRDIAIDFNLTESSISKYEAGLSELNYDLIVKFADYYDVSIDYLFSRNKYISDNNNKYHVRVSDDTLKLLKILNNEYLPLLKYMEKDPKRNLMLISQKMGDSL